MAVVDPNYPKAISFFSRDFSFEKMDDWLAHPPTSPVLSEDAKTIFRHARPDRAMKRAFFYTGTTKSLAERNPGLAATLSDNKRLTHGETLDYLSSTTEKRFYQAIRIVFVDKILPYAWLPSGFEQHSALSLSVMRSLNPSRYNQIYLINPARPGSSVFEIIMYISLGAGGAFTAIKCAAEFFQTYPEAKVGFREFYNDAKKAIHLAAKLNIDKSQEQRTRTRPTFTEENDQ